MSENPLIVKCKSCGNRAEYNIKEQSYCCPSCGSKTSVVDSVTNLANWRKKQQGEIKKQLHELPHTFTHCPNCGAKFFFKENEATGICPYCDTPLIRKDYDESDSFPESIVPFKITLEEAKEKLLDLIDKPSSSFSEEAELAKKNINKMQGYYLPYYIIMGPLNFNIKRANTKREFHCEVNVERNFINASKELDNLVLDAMEPYDWKEAVPFNFGYISGQSVKIRNIDEKELIDRAIEEVASQEKKIISKELDSEDIQIKSDDSVDVLNAPILLPVYYYKVANFTVAVNGQTGRVSMTNNHEKKKLVNYSGWIALFVTLFIHYFFISSLGIFEDSDTSLKFKIFIFFIFYLFTPIGLPFWFLPKKIKILKEKLPLASEKCLAIRQEDSRLSYKYGDDVIYEEIPKPYFWEKVESGIKSLKIDIVKNSSILRMSLWGMFGPLVISFIALIIASLYYKNIEIITKFISDKEFIKLSLTYIISTAPIFIIAGAIYNKTKYDSKLKKYYDDGLVLSADWIWVLFAFSLFVPVEVGLVFANQIKVPVAHEEKIINEEAQKTKIEEARKSVPDLKQNETTFIDVATKDKVVFYFNKEQRSYFIYFFKNNEINNYLFSVTINKDERLYYYGANGWNNYIPNN